MADVYLGCLIGGVLFALVSLLFSSAGGHHPDAGHPDSGHGVHLEFLKPVVVVSAIAGFGGAGLMLHRLAALAPPLEAAAAVVVGIALGAGVWLLTVRSMRNAEQSVGYRLAELQGKVAEVVTAIPARGYGEIIVQIGGGFTSRPATSVAEERIAPGTRVVIVEVEEGEIRVVPFE